MCIAEYKRGENRIFITSVQVKSHTVGLTVFLFKRHQHYAVGWEEL